MPKPPMPDLTDKQWESFCAYRELETKLGRAPTLKEFGEYRGYAKGSETAGAQRAIDTLEELGLVTKPEYQYVAVGGGTTALGLAVLKRYKGRG